MRQDTGFHNHRIERTSPLPLRRTELPTGTIELARFLIGKTLIRDLRHVRLNGRIVETEVYPPGDASGRTTAVVDLMRGAWTSHRIAIHTRSG